MLLDLAGIISRIVYSNSDTLRMITDQLTMRAGAMGISGTVSIHCTNFQWLGQAAVVRFWGVHPTRYFRYRSIGKKEMNPFQNRNNAGIYHVFLTPIEQAHPEITLDFINNINEVELLDSELMNRREIYRYALGFMELEEYNQFEFYLITSKYVKN